MTVAKKAPSPDLIDQLLAGYLKPEDILGEYGLLKQLTKTVVERALQAEMSAHLGHDKHEPVANTVGNTRNGTSRKTLKDEFGELPIEVPRDRQGNFEPQLIPKHQTCWTAESLTNSVYKKFRTPPKPANGQSRSAALGRLKYMRSPQKISNSRRKQIP